jgi:hypothetical protein
MWDDYDRECMGRKTSKADLIQFEGMRWRIFHPSLLLLMSMELLQEAKHISELQGTSEFVEIDSVGGTVLYVKSEIFRMGIRFHMWDWWDLIERILMALKLKDYVMLRRVLVKVLGDA